MLVKEQLSTWTQCRRLGFMKVKSVNIFTLTDDFGGLLEVLQIIFKVHMAWVPCDIYVTVLFLFEIVIEITANRFVFYSRPFIILIKVQLQHYPIKGFPLLVIQFLKPSVHENNTCLNSMDARFFLVLNSLLCD